MRDFSIDLIWMKVQIAITALGGWLGYFLGGMDGLMIALIVMMTLDYISGVMCAIIDKKLSSAVGFKGICKKVFILMLVGVAHIIDLHVVGTGSALRGAVICFYMSNEGLSLLENAAHIGLPIPDKLRDILGSKVWHSTDQYRRVIWRCNAKYGGKAAGCNTPHVTEEEVKAAFVRVVNKLIGDRATQFVAQLPQKTALIVFASVTPYIKHSPPLG